MAISQVRAQINGTWYALTYNSSTQKYEADITAPSSSRGQPGGYFPVTVEATSETGQTAVLTGEQYKVLRLVVTETSPPSLTLVSPQPGYLTTSTPTFTFHAQDEEGGSGIDPNSFTLTLDGIIQTEGFSVESEEDAFLFYWTPVENLTEGPHVLSFSVLDLDGNTASASASYIVDTIPPEMYIKQPYMRHVVDDETMEFTVEAIDGGSGIAFISAGSMTNQTGRFTVPLQIGENQIPVTAADHAGNITTQEVYIIRLVTDRTQEDVRRMKNLYMTYGDFDDWPQSEQEWFLQAACLRGAYTVEDWNRVGIASDFLNNELRKRGYAPNVHPKTDWTETDAPTRGQMETYRKNVVNIRAAQTIPAGVPLPTTMRKSGYQDWNNIEKALVETDAVFPNYFAWTAGEITAGEF